LFEMLRISETDVYYIGKEENEMKKFMEPAIEVEVFAVEDVVTTSGGQNPTCPYETPEEEV